MESQFALGKLHEGLTYEQYASTPGVRASDLHAFKKTPAHWLASKQFPRKETKALISGRLIHSVLENPEKALSAYVVEPVFTGFTKDGKLSELSGEAKAKKQAWRAEQTAAGKDIVTGEEADMLTGIINSISKHKLLKNILKNGIKETSLWVKDPVTGLTLQCRPDFIDSIGGFVIDYKSTRDASEGYFYNQIFSDRGESPFYILSAAHYAYCLKLAGIGRGDHFVCVAIEKEPPFGIMVYPLDIGCLDVGERWRAHLTQKFAECKEKNIYPCYPEEAVAVVPPEWAPYPPLAA